MGRKIILFELNEVPFSILDEYCRRRPSSNLARRMQECRQRATVTEDQGHLSPWITWPTLHRGVGNEKHCIHDFGQDLSEVDKAFPPLWSILASYGIRTGVCGSLHSYPLPGKLENYDFFLPDTFAAGPESHPETLSAFQDFNLTMARASARNVSGNVAWKAAVELMRNARALGLKAGTMAEVGLQLIHERTNPARKVRRRTFQSSLAFDVFMKSLATARPSFATFFTNHVASAMHRYWAAAFPGDYEEFGYDDGWVKTYGSEIFFAMDMADRFFGRLISFVDANPEYLLWVTSSMGQAATSAVPIDTQLYVTGPDRLMTGLGMGQEDWAAMPGMLPQFNIRVSQSAAGRFRAVLGGVSIDGGPVSFREGENGFFSLDFGQPNLKDLESHVVALDGKRVTFESMGLQNVSIEDQTGSNAYHIPEGCLLAYDPKDRGRKKERGEAISTLEIAPAILRNFSVPVPGYMMPVPRRDAMR